METKYTFDENTISDLHKDAYGRRPSSLFWDMWKNAHDDQKQAFWDEAIEALKWSIEQEKQQQAAAIVAVEARIQEILDMVAGSTRADAIRFLDDAYDTRGDINFLEFELGVPYGYLGGRKPGFLGPVTV